MLPNMCLDRVIFPFTASIYYAVEKQNDLGAIEQSWAYDRDILFTPQSVGDNSYRQDLDPGIYIKYDEGLMGRVIEDIRISSNGIEYSITETCISNICDQDGVCQYMEYGGTRQGQPTVFDIKTVAPSFDPFGRRDYFKIILTRAQDQTALGVTINDQFAF